MRTFNIKISLNGNIDTQFISDEDVEADNFSYVIKEGYCMYQFHGKNGNMVKTYQVPNHQICKVTLSEGAA